MAYVTRSITAENQFTDAIKLVGEFNLSIAGTFSANVVLQRSFDSGATWQDVNTWTVPFEGWDKEPYNNIGTSGAHTIVYRVGVKTGSFVSGATVVILGQA